MEVYGEEEDGNKSTIVQKIIMRRKEGADSSSDFYSHLFLHEYRCSTGVCYRY